MSMRNPKILKLAITLTVLTAVILGGWYWYNQRLNTNDGLQVLLDDVATLVVVPNELPTIATVTDKASLPEQQFFRNAENGDVVLIYLEAQKAILYRPSLKKIVEMAPVFVQSEQDGEVPGLTVGSPSQPSPSSAPEVEEVTPAPITAQIVLLNGSQTSGVTLGVQQQLLETFPELQILDRISAAQSDYDQTLVIDLSGNNAADAQRLAELLDASLGTLSESERRPEADIVILIGNDR